MTPTIELDHGRSACDDKLDALITPATLGTAPDPSTTGDPAFNSPWSYTGLPTVSFPIGLATDGLPVAIQLVGWIMPWIDDLLRTRRVVRTSDPNLAAMKGLDTMADDEELNELLDELDTTDRSENDADRRARAGEPRGDPGEPQAHARGRDRAGRRAARSSAT